MKAESENDRVEMVHLSLDHVKEINPTLVTLVDVNRAVLCIICRIKCHLHILSAFSLLRMLMFSFSNGVIFCCFFDVHFQILKHWLTC